MEYIISRGFKLPDNVNEFENKDWFNMWSNQQFPYKELLIGDILYWYDSTHKAIIWKTKVIHIARFPYNEKKEIISKFKDFSNDNYFQTAVEKGFFISYKVQVIEKVDFKKPNNFNFPRLGWSRVDENIAEKWLIECVLDDNNILDNSITNDSISIKEQLSELNKKMQYVSPKITEKLISSTIRNDTQFVNKLKEIADYKCQFPNCGKKIKKKNGGFYIEVAHIKPVSKGGQSVLGNLLVLCPNHHKEFDYGKLNVQEQTISKIRGNLNDKEFEIKLIY